MKTVSNLINIKDIENFSKLMYLIKTDCFESSTTSFLLTKDIINESLNTICEWTKQNLNCRDIKNYSNIIKSICSFIGQIILLIKECKPEKRSDFSNIISFCLPQHNILDNIFNIDKQDNNDSIEKFNLDKINLIPNSSKIECIYCNYIIIGRFIFYYIKNECLENNKDILKIAESTYDKFCISFLRCILTLLSSYRNLTKKLSQKIIMKCYK